MSYTVCKIPKAGLGNQLFPLMKAQVFAYLNNLPILITGYHQLKIGPYLRREKTKRNYNGFFLFEKKILSSLIDKGKILQFNLNNTIIEPSIDIDFIRDYSRNEMFLFSKVPHWDNYFGGLREHRELIKILLWAMIKPALKEKINDLPPPCIGVHIRMGDFRKLKAQENFGNVGAVRTPEEYFINTIKAIREINGFDLPVNIFSDGFKEELQQILALNNVTLIEGNNDLVDMMLLSKSQIIVTSAGSTFSYWASFLSESIVIMHPDHCTVIRKTRNIELPYEGILNFNDVILTNKIKKIIKEKHI